MRIEIRTSTAAVQVGIFHEKIGALPWDGPIADMPAGTLDVRNRLIVEEVQELVDATNRGDVVAIADALADLVYVAYGTAYTYRIPLDEVITEVHRANMSKDPGPTGKAVKGAGYRPPDVAGVLARVAADTVLARHLRFPTCRPGWLGEYQTHPCGRCGQDVDSADPHVCVGADCNHDRTANV